MNIRHSIFLFFGHMVSDFYPGLLSPLLPIILSKYDINMAQAGVIVMALHVACNLSQPFFGIWNDRQPLKHFLWGGLVLSAIPFCLFSSITSLNTMIFLFVVCGIGVGMFHPVAAVASGLNTIEKHRGKSMGFFSSGGSIGFTLSPIVMVWILDKLGDKYIPLMSIPAALMVIYYIFERDIIVSQQHRMSFSEWIDALVENKKELFILWLISSFRAIVSTLLSSFLPILLMSRGSSYKAGAYYLSGSLLAGMAGMLAGGWLSDIHGHKKIIALTLFLSTPAFYLFLYTDGFLSISMLLIGSALLSCTIPVNIVLAQKTAPKHAGIASSLIMGLSFVLGALAAPPFGALADKAGIANAMSVIFIIPVLGAATVFLLKKENS